MSTFVLLWSGGAIVTRLALDHSSVIAVLILRYGIALVTLTVFGVSTRQRWLPPRGTRWHVATTGLLMIGGYSVCYFASMDRGISPGLLATLLGVQPILTLLMTERHFSVARLLGLSLSLAGLTVVVYQSVILAKLSILGIALGLGALLCMTFGAVMQKHTEQAPTEVLPLQYAVTLVFYLCLVPFQPFHFELGAGFLLPLLYLALVISVAAQLLLYQLIRRGNLVNVTSLFYLVPVVTVILDYLTLGDKMSAVAIAGMAAILGGLALVFRNETPGGTDSDRRLHEPPTA